MSKILIVDDEIQIRTLLSRMVNCNLQHYSGESGLTYFTQLFVIMLFQFVAAATGMAAMAGVMKSIATKTTKTIGNFWNFLVLSCTRVLLPLSLIVGFILILQGTPMTFEGKMKITTLEGHGRAATEALMDGLPVIPRRKIFYKGKELEEMDLDAIIRIRPEIVIVDELAHTNVEGSRNEKRWQDVLELLDEGINVISAVNIQHIESLNEDIQGISGIEVKERIPDSVLQEADEVVNIDLTAEELITRLKAGKIYKPEKVNVALKNFFKTENILQLRELALKEVALRVEKKVENEVVTSAGFRHEKLTLSLACLIFFFIGAPLGGIIRKGGIGMPVVVSVLIFIIYYIINNTGYKMARDGKWIVWMGMWTSTAVLAPLGAFLTYKSNNDSVVFNADAYINWFKKIAGIRSVRHLFRKEVIIIDPDYSRLSSDLNTLNIDCRSYAGKKKLVHVDLINDIYLIFTNLGRNTNLLNQLPDIIYGIVGCRIQFVNIV